MCTYDADKCSVDFAAEEIARIVNRVMGKGPSSGIQPGDVWRLIREQWGPLTRLAHLIHDYEVQATKKRAELIVAAELAELRRLKAKYEYRHELESK